MTTRLRARADCRWNLYIDLARTDVVDERILAADGDGSLIERRWRVDAVKIRTCPSPCGRQRGRLRISLSMSPAAAANPPNALALQANILGHVWHPDLVGMILSG
jgi:hypothetical protein